MCSPIDTTKKNVTSDDNDSTLAKPSLNVLLRRSGRSTPCTDPDAEVLRETWVEHYNSLSRARLHPSHFMIPGFQDWIAVDLAEGGMRSDISTSFVAGNRDAVCNRRPAITANTPLQDRALCPWHHVMTTDSSRYPERLVEAECTCTGCRGGVSRSQATCEKIYYNVPVMRRTSNCSNGKYVWKQGWQRIASGCTCGYLPL